YALARYSRSPDSIADSLRWVHGHSAERFWEKFYFEYGHASIADLGHLAICLEGISELAAAEVLHEPLIDAQQKSTRYQDFGAVPLFCPVPEEDRPARDDFARATADLLAAYREVHAMELAALREQHPRPVAMDEDRYERTLAARAFDVARYLLPIATTTNVGIVLSIRTLERTIGRLLASPYAEVQALASRLARACQDLPDATWSQLTDQGPGEPLAPTLARHAQGQDYGAAVRQRARQALASMVGDACGGGAAGGQHESAGAAGMVDLLAPHELECEILATLLYRESTHSYRVLLGAVQGLAPGRRKQLLADILGAIGPHDEPPRELRCGYSFCFDIAMDWGGWRDMHRHRRCEQVLQRFDLEAKAQLPPLTADPGTPERIDQACRAAAGAARELAQTAGDAAGVYLLPFGHRVRCLFKMDFAEVQYISRLRTGKKGHDSYRAVAWAMAQAARKAQPVLGS
ncbi:MAG: FAD-dependent thymidylate synthase, partial [Cyanobacteria bacterium REEB65]|nr:FAD-dependent thymidylate synthase [Cyanobacteria bacterium REEB65]